MSVGLPLTESERGWRLGAIAAVAGFILVGTSALSSALAMPAGRLALPVALTATPAFLAVGCLRSRVAALTLVLFAPAALVAAGLPVSALSPGEWPQLVAKLGGGAVEVINADGRWTVSPFSLAAVMVISGALWTAGAGLGASGVGSPGDAPGVRVRLLLGFALLAGPWLAALSLRFPDHSAWQGAVVLVAGVLWFCGGRAALALAIVVAMPATALTQEVGLSSQWFGLVGRALVDPPFRTLDTQSTYGPQTDRRTGATMLSISAPTPALWRMQALDYSDGRWIVGSDALPELPEPAARLEEAQVRVIGLRQNLAVAPGRIDRVSARGKVIPTAGEGMLLAPVPVTGDSYRVEASDVHATAAQLSGDRAPLSLSARAYARVGASTGSPTERPQLEWLLAPLITLLGAPPPPPLDTRVVALARRLAKGAGTEWEIVTRVERYLLSGGRFRYTTDVSDPGRQPLADFLLRTHAGYCQQFAGAAALLLRLAGVPARVVTGFATGTQVSHDRYVVRDLDAHQWIEVYFEGYGWVPFNPTPTADAARIGSGIDPLFPRQVYGGVPEGLYVAAAVMALVAVAILSTRRRGRSRRPAENALLSIARQAGGEIEPSTTLAELRMLLAGRIGPRTAAVASEIERSRFAANPPVSLGRLRMRLARTLLADLGPLRSLLLWVPRRRPRR